MKTPNLDRYAARTVAEVLRMPGPAADELLDLAKRPREVWPLTEWYKVLAELERSGETVAEFCAFRS